MMNNLRVSLFLYKRGHMLDRTPPRNVQVIPLAEDTIQEAGSAEQAHVAAV
jgi:hypothetical protein